MFLPVGGLPVNAQSDCGLLHPVPTQSVSCALDSAGLRLSGSGPAVATRSGIMRPERPVGWREKVDTWLLFPQMRGEVDSWMKSGIFLQL